MWALLGRLIGFAAARVGSLAANPAALRTVATFVGIDLAGISIDELRNQASLHAGNTGPQGLEEAARTAARMLGLGGDQVLWPINRRTGQLIPPLFFTIDFVKGRAWYHSRLHPRRNRFGRFGRRWPGYGRGGWNRQPQNVTNNVG
jgi:hypothetical protein